MSFLASPRFLHRVLWADAAASFASGVLQLAALDALAAQLQLPRGLLLESGLFLVAYALAVAWTATHRVPPARIVAVFAAGNLAWGLACIAVLAGPWLAPSAWGQAWIAAQAAFVILVADLQWMALRRAAARGAAAMA